MQLVNSTPLPAQLIVSEREGSPTRYGSIVAKATYRFDSTGPMDLENEKPLPLFPGDLPTPLGLLPRDDLPMIDPAFEVVLLGQAYAPGGKPTGQMTVKLRVGKIEQSLLVSGDRFWEGDARNRRIGTPTSFQKMPLTWDRTFGGKAEVLIDKDSPLDIADPSNQYGKGFDPTKALESLRLQFTPPAPYPVLVNPKRALPNVEHPKSKITNWDDQPPPVSWSTVPMDLGIHVNRAAKPTSTDPVNPSIEIQPELYHRAHPDWVINLPAANTMVVLEGMTPEGTAVIGIHPLRVHADWAVGDQSGTTELAPQMLVILPELQKYTVTYRFVTDVYARPKVDRSIRLRLSEGWYQYA